MNDFSRKYGWIIFMVASIVCLIRYIRVEQTFWQIAGVLSFAILSLLLFKQSKDEKQSHKTFGKENHDYVQEAYHEEE